MKTVYGLKNKSILICGLLSMGVMGGSIPALATEAPIITNPNPLVVPTGTVKDLSGVEQRDIAQDLGGIGGTYEDLEVLPESDLEPEISAYEAQTRVINLRLEHSDEKLGDTSRITRRLPVLHF